MRLLIEQDNGAVLEITDIEGVSEASNTLILMCSVRLAPEAIKNVEEGLCKATGKRCVILGPEFARIIGV